ncbi:MAG: Holliday junction resolvase RuvX [Calditrichaeota bacterium]|nr:MAG: Holliday junction resolvase RuvX [Calditrichota bacterium]
MATGTQEKLPDSGRLMALDYGRVRVGIAVSDALQITAQPFTTIEKYRNIDDLTDRIKKICDEKNIAGIVVGLPINMDGTEGEMAQEVRQFTEVLRRTFQAPVLLLDERLTSVQAHRVLQEAGTKLVRAKGKVDQIAASFILRGYLDRQIH